MPDEGGAERGLTYRELGERLGIAPDSARTKAKRRGWRTYLDNHGVARVHVPPDELPDAPRSHPVRTGDERGSDDDERGAAPPLTRTLAELRDVLARTLAELPNLRAQAEAAHRAEVEARLALARAEAERDAARTLAAAEVEAMRGRMEAEIAARNAVIEELRAMLVETRKPFWRRWLGT